MLALVRSAASYDSERGPWEPYLNAAVRRSLGVELRRLTSPVYVPRGARPERRPRAAEPVTNDEGDEVPLVEVLASEAPGPDEQVETAVVVRLVRLAVAALRANDRRVVRARWLDGDGARTLDAAGLVLGITRQRVCQIEARAFGRLRTVLR